jgi:hypothetical protein
MAKVALLIGVDDYQTLEPLSSAAQNLEAIAHCLKNAESGFAESDMVLLLNPTRQQLEETAFRVLSRRPTDELLLFYFFGHGVVDEQGKLYLATRDTCLENGKLIKPTAVAATALQEVLGESSAAQQVLILDCGFLRSIAQTLGVDIAADVQTQFGKAGRAILTAGITTAQPIPQADSVLSLYTRYLIEGIRGAAADQEGWIELEALHTYTSRCVTEAAPARSPAFYGEQNADHNFPQKTPIVIGRSPVPSPQRQYRQAVSYVVQAGEIPSLARLSLNHQRANLKLSDEVAIAIETAVLAPSCDYQRRVELYRQALNTEIERKYPLDELVQQQLSYQLNQLELRYEDVAAIETNLLQDADVAYQQRLQQYEQALLKAIDLDNSLSETSTEVLSSLQTTLQLEEDDTAQMQEKIVERKQQELTYQRHLEAYRQAFLQAARWDLSLQHGVRERLNCYRDFLGLQPEAAQTIETAAIAELQAASAAHEKKLQEYEQAYQQAAQSQFPIRFDDLRRLDQLQQSLALSHKDVLPVQAQIATSIQAQRQAQHDKLHLYQQVFAAMVQDGFPVNRAAEEELVKLQHSLELQDDAVAIAQHDILAQVKANQETYQEKLQRYQQELTRTIKFEFPIQSATFDELQDFWRSLGIQTQDAKLIERRIWAQAEAIHGSQNGLSSKTKAI